MTDTLDCDWHHNLADLRKWAQNRRIVDAHILVQALNEIERLGNLLEELAADNKPDQPN